MSISNIEKLELVEKWTESLDCLGEYGFNTFIEEREEFSFCSWRGKASLDYKGFQFNSGATKVVIIDEDCDWVLKIPYDKMINHCQLEVENYEKAVAEGVEDAFAETFFLMEYKGAPCYAMRKAECNEEAIEESFYDIALGKDYDYMNMDSDERYEYASNLDIDEKVDMILKDFYNEDFIERVNNFIYINGINDLHMGNIGYLNNRLVYVDYSGYCA